jgi:hypothetical protein
LWFALAAHLGMSFAECQEKVSAREFNEWIALMAVDPWGEFRADLRNGILASMIGNMFLDKKGKPFKPSDFVITPGDGEIKPLKNEPIQTKSEREKDIKSSVDFLKFMAITGQAPKG